MDFFPCFFEKKESKEEEKQQKFSFSFPILLFFFLLSYFSSFPNVSSFFLYANLFYFFFPFSIYFWKCCFFNKRTLQDYTSVQHHGKLLSSFLSCYFPFLSLFFFSHIRCKTIHLSSIMGSFFRMSCDT